MSAKKLLIVILPKEMRHFCKTLKEQEIKFGGRRWLNLCLRIAMLVKTLRIDSLSRRGSMCKLG
jgi:hypothetical protein